MSIPLRVPSEGWIGHAMWLFIPPEADLSPLTNLSGKRLGIYQLEAAADDFAGHWTSMPPRFVLHSLVRIWAWPVLWLLLVVTKLPVLPITSLTTSNGLYTYKVGQPDPRVPDSVVDRISRGNRIYYIRYRTGGCLSLTFRDVDHRSIQREVP
jgi:hypothetical protein